MKDGPCVIIAVAFVLFDAGEVPVAFLLIDAAVVSVPFLLLRT